MNEVTLPPSPNWYLSNILSCTKDGTVAWGARNCLVIGKPQADTKILRYFLIGNAHYEKVNCIAFSPEYGNAEKNLLVSGGEEHILRIWNLDTMSAVSSQAFLDAKQKIIGVDWSKCDPDLVCFVSRDGQLMSWKITNNGCQLYTLGKFSATCLACSPHKPNILALGTKNGLVYIVNLQGNGTINYKLRGHDVEITSLSWCPIDENLFTLSRSKDMLLASGAKDRSIFVWRAGGDGRYQFELSIPVAPLDSQQHRAKLTSTVGNWTALCWAEPKLLFSSSSWGELISWDFSIGPKHRANSKLVHAQHTRGLFCIASVSKAISTTNDNWRDIEPTIVWTLAQDRQVIKSTVTIAECKIEYSVPTQGGYVYCIAACPLDTSRIAFGVGDAMIRLWNLSEPHETSFDVVTQWQKIMGKVRSVSWHPEKENILAFGTGEGRVGIWDTNTNTKPPILYRQHHRHSVYSLGWGPNPADKNFVLYSCGDNELVYYPSDKPTKEAKSVIKKDCTEFAWKPDFSCIAIGYEDGSIAFMDRSLKEIGKPMYALKKAVQCLAWHPDSTSSDLNFSPLRNYLAVAINGPTITIFDCADLFEASPEKTETADSFATGQPRKIADLSGHSDKIVCLAWSPHLGGYLVSGSYDSTVQVWKIESQEMIATYTGHTAPVQGCLWSPLDPDHVISASSDFTIRIWRISEQKVIFPSDKASNGKRVRTKKGKNKKSGKIETALLNDLEICGLPKDVLAPAETTNVVADISKDTQQKQKKSKKMPYLPGYSKKIKEKSIYLKSMRDIAAKIRSNGPEVVGHTNGNTNDDEVEAEKIPTIFGSTEEISQILDEEISSHMAQGHCGLTTEMCMWKNNLGKNLEEAKKASRLNDYLVSLSASLSFKTWQETCEAYASQLLFESNPTKAVSYLLAVHKPRRAIEILVDEKMYKEAFVLARSRLLEDDPIVATILADWAKAATKAGNLEEAAQCYAKLGDFAKAAKSLGRHRDIDYLELAAELGQFAETEPELGESLADQAIVQSLLASDVTKARSLLEKFPALAYRQAQVEAFAAQKEFLKNVEDSSQIFHDWLENRGKTDFLQIIRDRCSKFANFYERSSKVDLPEVSGNQASLWIVTSHFFALFAMADTREKSLRHLIAALGAICQFEVMHSMKLMENGETLLVRFLGNLESKSPDDTESLFADDRTDLSKSLRAFLCFGILNWLCSALAKQQSFEGLENIVGIVEKLLQDALDSRTITHWTSTSKINKLESSLTAALGKTRKLEEEKENNDDKSKDETLKLLEELDETRKECKSFLEERVCAPNPILVYSKAMELSILPDGKTRENFAKVVSEIWTKGTHVNPQ